MNTSLPPAHVTWIGPKIHHQFEHVVKDHPDCPAIIYGEEVRSYDELNQRVNQLANYLISIGLGPGKTAALYIERSIEMIEAVIAVLKTGAAYVPLDPTYPETRLTFMLSDSNASIFLINDHHRVKSEGGLQVDTTKATVCSIDRDRATISQQANTNPTTPSSSQDLAYIIYTSGSTGQPKGIEMGHDALANLVDWQLSTSRARVGTRTCQFSPLSFDVSFQEIFATLGSGGTLVLLSDEQRRDPFELLELLDNSGIERLFLPFVALQQLAESACTLEKFPSRLKEVITAGEQLVVTAAVRVFFDALSDCILWNHYGPSETHVITGHKMTSPTKDWPRLPSIGHPIANVGLHIMSEGMKQLPIGETGELCVSGICLAQGYINRSDLTEERFPQHPAAGDHGRIYLTGDLARQLSDGTFEFLGRKDQQVKINGYRIEPGEIESIISEHVSVSEVAIVPRELSDGKLGLIAYIVPSVLTNGDETEELTQISLQKKISAFLADILPNYMKPARYCLLENLPLTPSGKVDRKALPCPDVVASRAQTSIQGAKAGLVNIILAHWSELLGAPNIGTKDNVFDHGATSITVLQMQRRLFSDLGITVSAVDFFQYPSAGTLAKHLVPTNKCRSTIPQDKEVSSRRMTTVRARRQLNHM